VLASIPSFIDRWLTDRHIGGARDNCWSINLEHGSASLAQRLDWDSVETDELICVYPALLWSVLPRGDDCLPVRLLRRALLARVRIVLAQMAISAGHSQSSPASIYSALEEACGRCSIAADEVWHSAEAHEALAELYPDAAGTAEAGIAVASVRPLLGVNDIARAEACVIAALSNILAWAREPEGVASMEARSVAASEAVLASIYSGINAAYIYRHLDWAHELMTTAAWIGLLLRGRPAVLPVAVAERLIDLFERTPHSPATSSDLSDWILWCHAEAACSASQLTTAALNVTGSGRPQMVMPTRASRRRHVAILGGDGARIAQGMSFAATQTKRKDQDAATSFRRS